MKRSIERLAQQGLNAYHISQMLRLRGHKVYTLSEGYACAKVRFAQGAGQTVVCTPST
jgi:hypothetical protein